MTSKVFSVPSVPTNEPMSDLGRETTQNEGAIEHPIPGSATGKAFSIGRATTPNLNPNPNPTVAAPFGRRARANPFHKLKGGKSETITAPYPWATTRRARVHDLNYLQSKNIRTINGQVECKVCQTVYTIEYDIEEKLKGIKDFVLGNRWRMNDRAPKC
ncbi:hypothetical protein J1N35_041183 [Gossypium stocksii]|uniref:DUF7086 domain-containing protein n=1 Tax=Gossypium stocksii TaxID=47602 RepID=A0A9D3UFD1_9ROSI|nr:hypothetical protein J1N35_041183 [Gossypium stocksii]